jgi:hypothetical protein
MSKLDDLQALVKNYAKKTAAEIGYGSFDQPDLQPDLLA